MRKVGVALMVSVSLSACVSTRQFSDVQFTPPSGDYRLLIMRPDISVGSVTTGGMVEQRADWTETSRRNVLAAIRDQQAERGGNVLVLERRDQLSSVPAEQLIELERLHNVVGNSIALHKYMGYNLPTKRGKGLDWTLGDEAIRLGRQSGFDYALFMYAEDSFASTGRIALQVLGIAGCFVGFCAPNVGGGGQFAYASLVDLRSGKVVWFNVVQARSQVAGIKMGDIRTSEGAAQLVDRLLDRMKPGRAIRRQQKARS